MSIVENNHQRVLPDEALLMVTAHEGMGVYASADRLFKGAVFGRDSLEVAEDLMYLRPDLVERILLTLGSLQGLQDGEKNEEEVGKIVHEFRTSTINGEPLDPVSQDIFDKLSARWGGEGDKLAYYGSVDATPHFIRALCEYSYVHDPKFLEHPVTARNGSEKTMYDVLLAATDWMTHKLATSKTGLLEYQRKNPEGIQNQVWKDSVEFYVHPDGRLVDHDQPVASIEVQGLTYDALLAASETLPERREELLRHADKLRTTTLALLWLPENQYFALGIDHDEMGNPQVINTRTANPGALLDTRFFDGLPGTVKEQYVSGIVMAMFSEDFLTDAGIRSRSLEQHSVIPYWDYHGSFVTWPKETYDVAKGLRRQGFPGLAEQLEYRLLNAVRSSDIFPEFFYVDQQGRVLYATEEDNTHADELLEIDSTNFPESVQAWTVSAIVGILADYMHGPLEEPVELEWQIVLENRLLLHIPHLTPLEGEALYARYPRIPYRLKRDKSQSFIDFLHVTAN